jgi:hypothetical protein
MSYVCDRRLCGHGHHADRQHRSGTRLRDGPCAVKVPCPPVRATSVVGQPAAALLQWTSSGVRRDARPNFMPLSHRGRSSGAGGARGRYRRVREFATTQGRGTHVDHCRRWQSLLYSRVAGPGYATRERAATKPPPFALTHEVERRGYRIGMPQTATRPLCALAHSRGDCRTGDAGTV